MNLETINFILTIIIGILVYVVIFLIGDRSMNKDLFELEVRTYKTLLKESVRWNNPTILNIPEDEIRDIVVDCRNRVTGIIYYEE